MAAVDSTGAGDRTAAGGDSAMTGRLGTISAALVFGCAGAALGQQRFDSAEAAAQAVIDAAAGHDTAKLLAIFGPKGMLSSGDSLQDRAEQTEFARLAGTKHRLETSAANPNRAVLAIGDEDWPFPVPIVRTKGKWSFDSSEAPTEMQARRIGSDELDAIEICRGYVEAQRNYAAEDRQKGGMREYASRIMSTPGRQDGLYWGGAGQPLVPEGFAHAAWEGGGNAPAKPYHGYYFEVLERKARMHRVARTVTFSTTS